MKYLITLLFLTISLFANKMEYIKLYEQNKIKDALIEANKYAKDSNRSEPLYFIGKIYYYGDGVKKDEKKGILFFKKAAEKHNKDAIFQLNAIKLTDSKSSKKIQELSFKKLLMLARQGYAPAEVIVGMSYFYGKGVKKDYKQSFFWLRRAAIQGNDDANYLVGWMYATGTGVKEDKDLAIEHLKLPAQHGDVKALEFISRLMIERDKQRFHGNKFSAETVMWTKMALRNGVDLWKEWNDLELQLYEDEELEKKLK